MCSAAPSVLRFAPLKPCFAHAPTCGSRAVRANMSRPSGGLSSNACLGGVPPAAGQAWPLASLPAIYGGLGLQSAECAERAAPAAYWAACMDALPVIRSRLPQSAARCL